MTPRVSVRRDESLPKLAWYAVVDRRAGTCEVECGRFVEIDPSATPQWVAAGMWDGDFAKGDFHKSEHVYGSGLRVDGDDVVVVPAHSTVDRCVYARDGHVWHVSNSLVVLLGRMGARLDEEVDHRRWGESMCLGVFNYLRQFSVVHPRLSVMHQLIFEALHIGPDGTASFRFHDKPHEFRDFTDYRGQLNGALTSLWKNATDSRRARPMRAVGSASRGYDSGTVLAMVQPIVATPMISWTAQKSNTRVPELVQKLMKTNLSDDDGSEVAARLGATPRYLNLDFSKISAEMEAWCWATAQISPELAFHALLTEADSHDVPTIFFAGHAGDGVWELGLSEIMQTGQIIRGAQSGYALIEARARYGVVECSAPYLFSRSVGAIHRVSGLPEMSHWQLKNGYDRPICRRILEEAGVRREAFGWGKKAVAHDQESPQGEALREVFFEQSSWSPLTESVYRGVNLGLYFGGRSGSFVKHRGNRAKIIWTGRPDAKRMLSRWADLQRQTYLMTTGWLADRYARS
ncbi:MAG: hypothetical protein Q8K32_32435 [Archangium sp.]|nr:hypothetical protein [Archangium sp.]